MPFRTTREKRACEQCARMYMPGTPAQRYCRLRCAQEARKQKTAEKRRRAPHRFVVAYNEGLRVIDIASLEGVSKQYVSAVICRHRKLGLTQDRPKMVRGKGAKKLRAASRPRAAAC